MAVLEIIGAPGSPYVWTVRIACEEKGVDHELKPERPHSPEVAAIHPLGKVPVMRHGDFTLCESKAITTYIDRTFDGPKLIPMTRGGRRGSSSGSRSSTRRWRR
jgi:glutathione S-transferase